MKELFEVLRQKRSQVEKLRREIEALELAAKLVGGVTTPTTEEPHSIPQKVTAILQAEGKPLHVSTIVEQLRKKFTESVKPNNLSVLLYRYAQRGKRFFKVQDKPNTYGLIEWQAEKVVAMK